MSQHSSWLIHDVLNKTIRVQPGGEYVDGWAQPACPLIIRQVASRATAGSTGARRLARGGR